MSNSTGTASLGGGGALSQEKCDAIDANAAAIAENAAAIAAIPADTDTNGVLSGFVEEPAGTFTATFTPNNGYPQSTAVFTAAPDTTIPDTNVSAVVGSAVDADGNATVTVTEDGVSLVGTISCLQQKITLSSGSLDLCRSTKEGEEAVTLITQDRSGRVLRTQAFFEAADLAVDAVVMQGEITFASDKLRTRRRINWNYTYQILAAGDYDADGFVRFVREYQIVDAAGAVVTPWTVFTNNGGTGGINVSYEVLTEVSFGVAHTVTPTLPANTNFTLQLRLRVFSNAAAGPYRITFGQGNAWISEYRFDWDTV